jgi:hypothetical protein
MRLSWPAALRVGLRARQQHLQTLAGFEGDMVHVDGGQLAAPEGAGKPDKQQGPVAGAHAPEPLDGLRRLAGGRVQGGDHALDDVGDRRLGLPVRPAAVLAHQTLPGELHLRRDGGGGQVVDLVDVGDGGQALLQSGDGEPVVMGGQPAGHWWPGWRSRS